MPSLQKATLFFVCVTALISCKKDDDEESAPQQPGQPLAVSTFSNLAVGNYWVYERRQVDSVDAEVGQPVRIDSLFVIGDTLLGGQTFSMIRLGVNGQPGSGVRYYWRDSADCILDHYGHTVFRSTGFGEVFYTESTPIGAGALDINYSVSSSTVPISVPAGGFTTYQVVGECVSTSPYPPVPAWKSPRSYWTPGTGRVKWYEYYAIAPLGYRYELVRYHVQ